jgi:hypothetical protein
MGIELLLQLLVGPIDTELLKRVLLEVLETVLIVRLDHAGGVKTYDIKNTDELGSLLCTSSTLST